MRLEECIKNDMQLGNCIYIYGAGTVATDIYRRFKKAGIKFSGAVVDDAYFEDGKKLDDELKIFPIGSIQTDNVSVIAGNADYVKIRKKCDDLGIKKVYFSVRTVDMNLLNGWGSVRHVISGILLWRRSFQ